MAKKQQTKLCEECVYKNGVLCTHECNKGVIVKYRIETPVYLKTCAELNKDGGCKNFKLSKK